MLKTVVNSTYKIAKRIVIMVVGFTLLIVGVVMLVAPGPGLVAVAGALAILAIEFAWARLWLRRIRRKISDTNAQLRGR